MKYLYIVISILVFNISCFSQEPFKKGEEISFQPGEKLDFVFKYGFIKGGEGEMKVDTTIFEDKEVFHAVAMGKTVGVVHTLFNVKDIYQSYFEKGTGLPVKAIRDIHEGRYTFYNEVTYDRDSSQVISKKSGVHEVPENILDIVSAFYYLRRIQVDTLKIGDIIKMETFFGDELFPFWVRYKGIEDVKVKLGKINCLRFDPIVEPGRMFESEDDMSMWISNDNNLVPVRVKFDLLVGSFKCDLVGYQNLKYDIRFR